MSELLMQAIIEKLEGIELFLKATDCNKSQPVDRVPMVNEINALKKELPVLLARYSPDAKKLDELTRSIDRLQQQIRAMPDTSKVEHRHHFHKGTWIAIALFLVSLLLAWGWANTYKAAQLSEVNDIKYRHLKIAGNQWVLQLCSHTDSLYLKDETRFRNKVEQEEQRLIQQAELLHLAGEKEKEARVLKDRAGR